MVVEEKYSTRPNTWQSLRHAGRADVTCARHAGGMNVTASIRLPSGSRMKAA
jgi:hypothetical protein